MKVEELTEQGIVFVLAETKIEERDGATWVCGVCPFCWDSVAFRMPPAGRGAILCCPRGLHLLRIIDLTSAGAIADPETSATRSRMQSIVGARDEATELPDGIETNDYHEAYREDYDRTYGSAREIGISGVLSQPSRDEDKARERSEHEHDRAVRREEERKAIDAASGSWCDCSDE